MNRQNNFNQEREPIDSFEDNFRYAAGTNNTGPLGRDVQLGAEERGSLDRTDEDGDPLNEETDRSGRDLDIPGAEDDDEMEDIGEEDEENNSYSRSDNNDE